MNNLEFALEMKNKRLASGLSQGELASLTHVSRNITSTTRTIPCHTLHRIRYAIHFAQGWQART